jgi:hypothetical protein
MSTVSTTAPTPLAPGVYRARDPHCWTSFTLYTDGRVEFVDAADGHITYWALRPSGQTLCDGAEWSAHMQQLVASGELVFEAVS